MSSRKILTFLPCAALVAALPLSASAQEQSGMVVARDAQTGQLRPPTPAEMRALAPAPSASMRAQAVAPSVVTHPGGSKQVKLGERGLVYSVVTRDADGKLHDQCVQGEKAAEKAVHATAGAPRTEEPHHD